MSMTFFKRIRQAFLGGPVFVFFFGLIFFGIGAGLTYGQIIFRKDALQTQGVVMSLSENCDNDGCAYSPVVRFTTQTGETAYYHSNFSSSPPEYIVGETVPILYKSENPDKALIAGEGGIFRFIFMGIGGVIILASLLFFASNLKNSYFDEG